MPSEKSLVDSTLDLDIRTASYYELVAWCRSLGLDEQGTKQDLIARIRQAYKLPPGEAATAKNEGRTITVESAQQTSYFSVKEANEDYVRLSGGVVVILRDDKTSSVHRIEAQEILFNKTKNYITAKGKIVYTVKKPDTTEYFYGDSLTFDLNTWKGDFLNGINTRPVKTGTDSLTYYFSADSIDKNEGSVLVLNNGEITSSTADPPNYTLKAKKMWLLGPNEWAVSNAILYVGTIPVFYMPYFYYPGEEIVFHPVFGYRLREGTYVQTTTYLIGKRPESTTSSSLLTIGNSGATNNEKELKGVFLRTTDKKKTTPDTTDSLKILVDAYTQLGYMIGTEGHLTTAGALKSTDFSLYLAKSRTIHVPTTGYYTPYADDGVSDWNDGYFGTKREPIRVGESLKFSLQDSGASFNVSMPFYTDPYVMTDFGNRAERLNLTNLLSGTKDTVSTSSITSYTMSADGAYTPTLPFLSPWVSNISLSRVASSLSWTAKTNSDTMDDSTYSPEREFFLPNIFTVVDSSMTIGGTLYQYPEAAQAPATTTTVKTVTKDEKPKDATAGVFRSPWDGNQAPAGPDTTQATPSQSFDMDFRNVDPVSGLPLPVISDPFSAKIYYSLNPRFGFEQHYDTTTPTSPSQVTFDPQQTLRSSRFSGDLTFSLGLYGQLLGLTDTISVATQQQTHPYLDSSLGDSSIASIRTGDYSATNTRFTDQFKLMSLPFQNYSLWQNTGITYTLTTLLFEHKYDTTSDVANPRYLNDNFKWTKDYVTGHSIAFNLAVQPWSQPQSLNLSYTLPPLNPSFVPTLALSDGIFKATATTRIYKDDDHVTNYDPLAMTAAAQIDQKDSFQQTFNWSYDHFKPVSAVSTLTVPPFATGLTIKQATELSLQPGAVWVEKGSEAFRPTDVTFQYKDSIKPDPFWKNRMRLSFDISSNLAMNLIQYTQSTLDFGFTVNYSIDRFTDLSFSSYSLNSNVYRYFPFLYKDKLYVDRPAINPLRDILYSFDFFNSANREASLFKLKTVTAKITHHLDDWDISFALSGKPVLNTAVSPQRYDFQTSYSFSLTWRSASEIHANFSKDTTGVSFAPLSGN